MATLGVRGQYWGWGQRQVDPESLLASQSRQNGELQDKVEARQNCPVIVGLTARPPNDLSSIPEDTHARKRRSSDLCVYHGVCVCTHTK